MNAGNSSGSCLFLFWQPLFAPPVFAAFGFCSIPVSLRIPARTEVPGFLPGSQALSLCLASPSSKGRPRPRGCLGLTVCLNTPLCHSRILQCVEPLSRVLYPPSAAYWPGGSRRYPACLGTCFPPVPQSPKIKKALRSLAPQVFLILCPLKPFSHIAKNRPVLSPDGFFDSFSLRFPLVRRMRADAPYARQRHGIKSF